MLSVSSVSRALKIATALKSPLFGDPYFSTYIKVASGSLSAGSQRMPQAVGWSGTAVYLSSWEQ